LKFAGCPAHITGGVVNEAFAVPPILTSRVSYNIRLLHKKFALAIIRVIPGPFIVVVTEFPVPIGNALEVQFIV
jgi:hypothetical protein